MNKDNVGYSNKFQNDLKQKFSLEKLSKKTTKLERIRIWRQVKRV
jgi:hypothetical protein